MPDAITVTLPCGWVYVQDTGVLYLNGQRVDTGYSGHADGLDNPTDEAIPNVGPLPAARYSIGEAFVHPRCGPVAMRLTPLPGEPSDGRGGFLIHGDNQQMNHTASDGCIILDRPTRERIAASACRTLTVIHTESA